MKEIKKFEFVELPIKITKAIEVEIPVSNIAEVDKEVILETFADENILEELVPPLEAITERSFIKITQEELDESIAKAKDEAIADYIMTQSEISDSNDIVVLGKIADLVKEIKDRVDIEFEDILDKLLQLSFAIAAKVIDIQLMNLSQKTCIDLIKSKIVELDFHNGIKVEVKDEALAQALATNGIEVSINGDMLAIDYKIVWCNGFLERKASDIAAHIEEILIDQIKK